MPAHGYASASYLKKWYRHINDAAYKGRLPDAEIIIGKPSRRKFNPAQVRILSNSDGKVEKARIVMERVGAHYAIQLLIHEMVHIRYPEWDHSLKFDREIFRVRRDAFTDDYGLF